MSVVPLIDPEFESRLRRLTRKHRRMVENGSVTRVGPDGLTVEYPRRRLPRFPLRALVLMVAAGLVFKVWVFGALGAAEFAARLDVLAQGNAGERAAAWLFQPEPVTTALSQFVSVLTGRSGA
ncbi:MAG: hypothetical protein IT542_04860 [Rubellimicrobium sp.]|nr:hypothetical protein [Rubellimicrobium sp.]